MNDTLNDRRYGAEILGGVMMAAAAPWAGTIWVLKYIPHWSLGSLIENSKVGIGCCGRYLGVSATVPPTLEAPDVDISFGMGCKHVDRHCMVD